MEAYRTVKKQAETEFSERRSRFIGRAAPVKTEAAALAFLAEVRIKCRDATHNVYAYRLQENNNVRCSDDGEPQGTAGVPVLDVLQKSGVTNTVLVVTRYFGGILLGAGGLVRAYSHSASLALCAAEITQMSPYSLCSLSCEYSAYSRVAALIPAFDGVVDAADFGGDVKIKFHLPPELFSSLNKELANVTCGKSAAQSDGMDFFEKSVQKE